MKGLYRHVRIAGAGLAMIAGSGAVHGQEVSNEAEAVTGDIVVTATRRSELQKDVPIALSAFGQRELEQRQATDITALQGALPNVSLNASGSNLTINPIIRGISSNTRNAGVESGLAVYVDGVYTGRPETFNQGLEDARSVEVLRGPQGTLFGKNSIAGALSVTTNDPTANLGGRITVEGGSDRYLRLSALLNVPIAEDIGARLVGYRGTRDGFVRNLFSGETVGNDNYWGGRAKLRFAPTTKFDVVIAADYRTDDRRPYLGENLFGRDTTSRASPKPVVAPGPFTINDDHRPNAETRTLWGGSITANFRTDSDFTLTSITAYRSNKRRLQQDNDFSPRDVIYIDFFDAQRQFSQELRLVSPDRGALRYVAGFYYYNQDSDTVHVGGLGAEFAIPGLIPGGIQKLITPSGTIKTTTYAGYVDGSLRIAPGLDILAGVRITREEKAVTFSVTPDAAAAPLFYTIPFQADQLNDTDVTPTIGLRYQVSDDLTTYAKLSRGFKSGGWNLDFISRSAGRPTPTIQSLRFSPEKVTNYEIGAKGEFLDRRLRVNLAAFYMDYRDLQVTQFFGLAGGAVTSNAASAKIKGIEGDISARIARGLTVGIAAGYNDATYDRFPGVNATGASADGKRLPGPAFTGSANLNYEFGVSGLSGKFAFFSEYSFRGAGYVTPLNELRLRQPERSLLNARLSYNSASWSLALYVNNLLDNTYIESVADDAFSSSPEETVTYGRPRSFGAVATLNF